MERHGSKEKKENTILGVTRDLTSEVVFLMQRVEGNVTPDWCTGSRPVTPTLVFFTPVEGPIRESPDPVRDGKEKTRSTDVASTLPPSTSSVMPGPLRPIRNFYNHVFLPLSRGTNILVG